MDADSHLENTSRIVGPNLHRGPHVFLAADWSQVGRFGRTARACMLRLLPGSRQAHYRHAPPCEIGLGYVANTDLASPGAPWHARTHDQSSTASLPSSAVFAVPSLAAARPHLVEFVGSYYLRATHRDRRRFLHERPDARLPRSSLPVVVTPSRLPSLPLNKSLPLCRGPTDYYYCRRELPVAETARLRAQSEFALYMRGDDESSDRLQNAFTMLQIPLVVGAANARWLPFPSAIPWERIVLTVPQEAFDRRPAEAVLSAIATLSPAERARRRQLMHAHLPDLLWTVDGSRVADNFLREAAVAIAQDAPCTKY